MIGRLPPRQIFKPSEHKPTQPVTQEPESVPQEPEELDEETLRELDEMCQDVETPEVIQKEDITPSEAILKYSLK